jgi:hypothetical protein
MTGPTILPQNVVRILVALSDQLDDKFRNLAGRGMLMQLKRSVSSRFLIPNWWLGLAD